MPDRPGYLVLLSTKQGSIIQIAEQTFALWKKGEFSPHHRKTLSELGFIVSDPLAERDEMYGFVESLGRRQRRICLTVILNMDCNLDCRYCFEGQLKGYKYMSEETVDRLVTFIEREIVGKGKKLHINFYGGEPLLSIDLIKTIAGRLNETVAERKEEFSFGLVTNGTLLTPAVVNELVPFGLVSAKVTIDGPKETHDYFRPFVSGMGSFDCIVSNLRDASGLIRIAIGGNYSRDNYRQFPALLDHLLAEGITPGKLSLLKFDPIVKTFSNYGLPEYVDGCAGTYEEWIFEASVYLHGEILKRGFPTPRMQPSQCMVDSKDDLVVSHEGLFYKCPAFVGLNELAVGNLLDGIADYSLTHHLDAWKSEECLDCAYLPFCFGGCRMISYLNKGTMNGVDCRKEYLDATLGKLLLEEVRYRGK